MNYQLSFSFNQFIFESFLGLLFIDISKKIPTKTIIINMAILIP